MKKLTVERKKLVLRILINILVLAVVALGLTYLMVYRQFLNNGEEAGRFVTERPKVFYFTSLIIFGWLLFLTGIVRKVNWAAGISLILLIIITYINICKFRVRGTPLLPEDFYLAGETGSLADFVDGMELLRLGVAVGLIIVLTIILGKILKKARLELFTSERKKTGLVWRIGLVLIGATMLVGTTGFVRHHHGEKYEWVEFLETTFTAWNQTRNYNENGFLLGFLYNLAKLDIKAPEGYSEEKIKDIRAEFEKKIAEEQGSEKSSSAEPNSAKNSEKVEPNIVIILNESFIDPEGIAEYYKYSGDITPNLHEIEKRAMSGEMFSIDYGGGTANVEFEMLTGLTNYWLNTVPYTNLLSKRGELESIASELKAEGYSTVAIHPNNGGMYKRNIVLKNEGFEKLIFEEEMNFKEKEGDSEYINDWSSYQEILKELREGSEPKLVFNITMQNHTPFRESTFGGVLNFRLENELVEDEDRRTAIAAYFESLNRSDEYLGRLIREIDMLEEETVVLFFGDHSAGIFDELRDSENLEEVKLTRMTPYFVYANYDVENEKYTRSGKLVTVTPNCLTAEMRRVIGLKESALNRLTREVCEETPILTSLYYNYEPVKETKLLEKYKLVTYDLAAGSKFFGSI